MRIAAVNIDASFTDLKANMNKAAILCKDAVLQGVELILFPEFFTSSMGYSKKMIEVAVNSKHLEEDLKELSSRYHIIIGGSYIFFEDGNLYNKFSLIFPNGEIYSHCKDIPTLVENCYTVNGDEDHILHTPIGDIGVALCWEMVRYDTLKRLSKKVDVVLAGMCWSDLPDWEGGEALQKYNRDFAMRTPIRFAQLLHVPVIHSNHCGKINAYDYPNDNNLHNLQMIGATQIIDLEGKVIIQRKYDEGEGLLIADISWNNTQREPAQIDQSKYWIEDLPESYLYAWEHHNATAHDYYEKITIPYLFNVIQRK